MVSSNAIIPLYEYQKAYINDRSRFKFELWCRQAGKDFVTSLGAVLDAHERKTDWVMLGAGEGQTQEWINQARVHAQAIDAAAKLISGREEGTDGKDYLKLELRFPNGARILGLPANPRTARGHSANVILNEFAFHQDSRQIWRAVFPTVTRGYRLVIITTPNGKNNKAYDMWIADNGYAKHQITIHDAIAQGLVLRNEEGKPCTPEELKHALADDEAWAQEYLLEFLDEVSAWLTYELISQVEAAECVKTPPWVGELINMAEMLFKIHVRSGKEPPVTPEDAMKNILAPVLSGELYLGMDIARTRDLSVIWLDQKVNTVLAAEAVIELRKAPFFVQKFILGALLSLPNLRRACLDQSGLGRQLAEEAQLKYGAHKVEGIDFTAANKEALAVLIKQQFEDKLVRIPSDPAIRASLHSVKRYQTATGNFRFDAERTDKTGHADHFWAKALSSQAATSVGPAIDIGRDPEPQEMRHERKGLLARMMQMGRAR
jgi:phage FluMu gp28-like protein